MNTSLRYRRLLPWIGVALVVGLGPYLLAWALTPAGKAFTGTLANHNDFSAYIAAMRQGGEGNWLFHFNFSPESWQPQLMLPLYMIVGKLIRPFGGAYVLWFNIMRAVAIVFTLTGFWFWVRQALPDNGRQQMTAWMLLVFGGGLSWLLWPLLASFSPSLAYFPDINRPEWTTILIFANPPHYILGLGLEAFLFGILLKVTTSTQGVRWALLGMVVALCLGLIYVYHTAVVGGIVGLYLLLIAVRERRIPWRLWWHGALILLPLVPLVFYYGYWVNRDPVWARYVVSSHNHLPPPPLAGLLIGVGLIGILAITAVPLWQREKQPLLVPTWIVGNLLLMYVPIVQYSARFALGLMIPITTLAAFGLERVLLPKLQNTRFHNYLAKTSADPTASLRRIVILLTLPSGLMVTLFLAQNVALNRDFPNYLPLVDVEAAHWLATQTDDTDIVLADYPIGNYLPSISNARVFVGQFFLTSDYDAKLQQMEQYWQAETPDSWREELIRHWGITYVFQGTYENSIMSGTVRPMGEVVYDADGVTIYKVSLTAK